MATRSRRSDRVKKHALAQRLLDEIEQAALRDLAAVHTKPPKRRGRRLQYLNLALQQVRCACDELAGCPEAAAAVYHAMMAQALSGIWVRLGGEALGRWRQRAPVETNQLRQKAAQRQRTLCLQIAATLPSGLSDRAKAQAIMEHLRRKQRPTASPPSERTIRRYLQQ
jgi:hypothetical protein